MVDFTTSCFVTRSRFSTFGCSTLGVSTFGCVTFVDSPFVFSTLLFSFFEVLTSGLVGTLKFSVNLETTFSSLVTAPVVSGFEAGMTLLSLTFTTLF